jgi:hypothetical protein
MPALCRPYARPIVTVIRHLSSQRARIHTAADASETKAAGNEKARELKCDRSVVELFAAEREVVRRKRTARWRACHCQLTRRCVPT